MKPHQSLSTYLVHPAGWRQERAKLWRRRISLAAAHLPRLNARILTGIGLWVVVVGTLGWAVQQNPASASSASLASSHTASVFTPPADVQLADAKPAATQPSPTPPPAATQVLPAGPTGLMLPPGTMAAPYTYANSYSSGQCTWYVAGRRPIPGGWGNANSWLSHARAAGWSTGSTPAIAAIAWTSAGWFGHVALVEAIDGNQVLVSEMNYRGPYVIDKRWVPASNFQYIY